MQTRSFRTLFLGGCLLLAGAASAPPALSMASGVQQRQVFERALGHFRDAQYSAAYGRFMQLADAGHAPAARFALLMHAEGAALFDSAWSATPGQLRRWQELVARTRRAVALETSAE